MKVGKYYDVVFCTPSGKDVNYESNVKCLKITPKGYRVEREDGKSIIVIKDAIMELKQTQKRHKNE